MVSAAASRRALIEVLRVLPRNGLSRAAGWAAGIPLPGRLQAMEIAAFARLCGADLSEVEQPIEAFRTLQEFFARSLRPGARAIDADADSFVAPCDGAWGESGVIEGGRLCQIKGRTYGLASLLGDGVRPTDYEGGVYATFYLAPRDYHRFHTPCAVRIVAARHIAGTLWPVNRAGLEGIENLFARNERIVAYARAGAAERPPLCMVAVGAVIVGKIRLVFDDLTSNTGVDGSHRVYDPPISLAKGVEWGRFELGSTIVLIAPPGMVELESEMPGSAVRLGMRIGTLK